MGSAVLDLAQLGVNLFLAPCVHCATDPLSQVGWLLWLLLEALPQLLMLAAFLVFDINLLAGPLNSYLLYVQFVNASWPISSIGPITITTLQAVWLCALLTSFSLECSTCNSFHFFSLFSASPPVQPTWNSWM